MTYIITTISVIILLMVLVVGMIMGIYASILWGADFNRIVIGFFRWLFRIKPKDSTKRKR